MKKKARDRLPVREPGSFPSFLYKSLGDLEGDWGGASSDATSLIEEAHELHRKPLIILTDDELALALQQKIGLPWTLELAIVRLRQDPLRCGVFGFPGDVLRSALSVGGEHVEPRLSSSLKNIADAIVPTLDQQNPEWTRLIKAYRAF